MKVVVIHETGGPEVMKLEERPTPQPGSGQALVKVAAIGVNFVEIYNRSGMYKINLPMVMGGEGAGTVEAIGPDVTEVKPGDRVAWLSGSGGSYATDCLVQAAQTVPIPDGLSFEMAAAALLQGVTAHVFARATYPLKPGDRCLVHAAAGGVGLLLCQVAKMAGAFVIGTTSTQEKADRAREVGADEMILYTQQDFEAEVKRITDGRGVQVVYDSVGKDTFDKSLNCLAPLGYMVCCGQSSGFPPPLDIRRLAAGSLFLTRPIVFNYLRDRATLLHHATTVLEWVRDGTLKVRIDRIFPLEQAAEAHRALASRATSGKLLLIP
jgi:NADPH:quinone reductase